jgi:DNA-binding response OmpR family regulator
VLLVVDDDPRVRQTIQWTLEDEGYVVLTAADGREALECAAARRPDLIVLDITLPVLDGFEVARALRAAHGEMPPILAITADGQAQAKAERVGAYTYVRKPFEIDALLSAVRAGLQRPH